MQISLVTVHIIIKGIYMIFVKGYNPLKYNYVVAY